MTLIRLMVIGAGLTLAATPAFAWHHSHRHIHSAARAAPAYGYGYGYGYSPYAARYGWQYEAIERATSAEQAAPGLTEELAPDAKETATGGPVGGVPGFSGGH